MWKQEAIKLFNNGMSLRKIEKEININRKRISKMLKDEGITIKKKIDETLVRDLLSQGKTMSSIANKIGVDRNTLTAFMQKNNIKANRKNGTQRNTDLDQEIIQRYKNNESMLKISKELKCSTNKIAAALRANNINTSKIYRTYSINENVFETIDTEEKAYWLGFLYADGYVNTQRGIELTLKEDDIKHIEKFKSFLKSEQPIRYIAATKAYTLRVYSTKLSKDLTNLGCHQNKSLTLKFPTESQVPKNLIHHFMRGYFDGDGTICKGQGQYRFSVIGTIDFIDKYDDVLLTEINRSHKNKYTSQGKAFCLQRGGNLQVLDIINFLYKDATIYLERKYERIAVLRQRSLKS